jgi:ArsR family transcriptional regulator, arsenate/arsenite/antimonite-responsive transcriptional repressor
MKLKSFSLNYGALIFKALSDESRIRILSLLFHHKELCISDIEHILDFTQSKTSRHLIYLKNSRIVNYRKVNNWVLYYLVDEVSDIIGQVFSYMSKDQVLQNDLETFKILYSNRELVKYKMDNEKWFSSRLLK